jgi:hypothetical protein
MSVSLNLSHGLPTKLMKRNMPAAPTGPAPHKDLKDLNIRTEKPKGPSILIIEDVSPHVGEGTTSGRQSPNFSDLTQKHKRETTLDNSSKTTPKITFRTAKTLSKTKPKKDI